MSGVVTTVIMIGLVIAAIGIVWALVSNIIESEAESIDYSQKCLGVNLNIETLNCNGNECNITLKRQAASKSTQFDGVGITLESDAETTDEQIIEENIATSKTMTIETDVDVNNAKARIYFNKENNEKYFCSQIATLS